ncbi:Gfo/Idh/MocA family protein [Microbacterium sp. NPDC058021]|uniref:Gfo/Idh/MocA family protein n=1 Tax=Microbacterium sp. NPDC058021 TaxID=3346306 RepID=UPI0036D8A48B
MRVALVGAGTMGSFHARVVNASARTDLAFVVESREETGRAVAERYGATWVPTLDDIGDVDAVVVAASTEAHRDLATAVLERRLPLLVEKPLVDDYAQAAELVRLSRANDTPLLCGFLERFNPAVLTAQHLIEQPLHVTATRHSPYAPRIRTGVAWDLLIHDVDLAINVLRQEPQYASGTVGYFHPSSAPGAEDVASATLTFADGQLAQLSASRIGQRKERTVTIHELDKLVELDLLRRTVTVYRHVTSDTAEPDGRGYRQQTTIEIPEITQAQEPLAAQWDHFVDLVEGTADAESERTWMLPAHAAIASVLQPLSV